MKNKDFIVNGKKIGYFDDGMIVVTDPEIIKENQPPKTEKLTFGEAVEMMKHGNYVSRRGWGERGRADVPIIYIVERSEIKKENLRGAAALSFKNSYDGCTVFIHPHIDMKKGTIIVCGWIPTADDILSEDWYINNP